MNLIDNKKRYGLIHLESHVQYYVHVGPTCSLGMALGEIVLTTHAGCSDLDPFVVHVL